MSYTNYPLINHEVLDQLQEDIGEETCNEALDTFIQETLSRMNEISSSFEQKQFEEVERHFHTIKSNAKLFGAERLSTIARDLEHALSENNHDHLDEKIKSFNTIVNETVSAYHENVN